MSGRTLALGLAALVAAGAAGALASVLARREAVSVFAPRAECVLLVHGLSRGPRSMRGLAERLTEEGFSVVNVDYPSNDHSIETLARDHVRPALQACPADAPRVHFVTHSMGGVLVRALVAEGRPARLGRAVMLAPPSRGSEVAESFRDHAWFEVLLGPAATQLGTDPETGPARFGPVDFSVGVITGSRSNNPITSSIIPGPDDGKVSVERARITGMNDFLVVDRTHTFIMNAPEVRDQVVHFLRKGHFERAADVGS